MADSDRIVDTLDTAGFLDEALREVSGDVPGCNLDVEKLKEKEIMLRNW